MHTWSFQIYAPQRAYWKSIVFAVGKCRFSVYGAAKWRNNYAFSDLQGLVWTGPKASIHAPISVSRENYLQPEPEPEKIPPLPKKHTIPNATIKQCTQKHNPITQTQCPHASLYSVNKLSTNRGPLGTQTILDHPSHV